MFIGSMSYKDGYFGGMDAFDLKCFFAALNLGRHY